MTYIIETHSESAAAILQQLAKLELLTIKESVDVKKQASSNTPDLQPEEVQFLNMAQSSNRKKRIPLREKSLSGKISLKTSEFLQEHLRQTRNEWDRI
ncbi:MAG: hypothetical protein IT269_08980 [Saprospiraceae bacterium]|nr:hypothetical protein [Saprospiraceae bacterium]